MKKIFQAVLLTTLALAFFVVPAQSFNPAAHVYIVDHLFPNNPYKADLYYGSIAPDLAIYTDQAKWDNAFTDTHYDFINLIPLAQNPNQKAFAKGWFTHNEINGADSYAHGVDGYVTEQSQALLTVLGIGDEYLGFAHFAIEAAIDFLLKREHDPLLGTKLLTANLFRSPVDRELMVRVFVKINQKTDWLNLVTTEFNFRSLVHQYASALALPKPYDKQALINLGVQLAKDQFGMEVTPDYLRLVLNTAIGLCRTSNYYQAAILPAISGIRLP